MIRMELDDGSELDVVDVRAGLMSHAAVDRIVVYLIHFAGAELAVGFRADRAVGLWQPSGDDPAVTTGGTNSQVITYGWSEIPVPVGAEIDVESVVAAAEEFARTGQRPTGVRWRPVEADMFEHDATCEEGSCG